MLLAFLQAVFSRRPLNRLLCWRAARSVRRAAITLDDGPNDHTTPAVLALLDAAGVKATFFLVGREVAKHPEIVREIAARGHEIGIHGYDHSAVDIAGQVSRCARELARCGVVARLVRPPAGRVTAADLVREMLAGRTSVLWSFDAHDSMRHEGKWSGPGPDYRDVRPGDIILMHDDNPVCLGDLPALIAALRESGIAPVTVSELLGARGARAAQPPGAGSGRNGRAG